MIKMFAIPNCDTVKKARSFLQKSEIDYEFIDFKKVPPKARQIKACSTYRKYKDEYEALNAEEKIEFIIANPSIIKRPVLEKNGKTFALGFDEELYSKLLA